MQSDSDSESDHDAGPEMKRASLDHGPESEHDVEPERRDISPELEGNAIFLIAV